MNTFISSLARIFLILLHLFLGINGAAGGALLMLKPDGSLLAMNTGWLADSPFTDYFLPGLMLFAFVGLLSLLMSLGLIIKMNWKIPEILNIYRGRHWSWTYSLYSGIISITWITVQLMVTQYFWLQPVIIFIALLIIICTMTPAVMKYYETNKK